MDKKATDNFLEAGKTNGDLLHFCGLALRFDLENMAKSCI